VLDLVADVERLEEGLACLWRGVDAMDLEEKLAEMLEACRIYLIIFIVWPSARSPLGILYLPYLCKYLEIKGFNQAVKFLLQVLNFVFQQFNLSRSEVDALRLRSVLSIESCAVLELHQVI